VNAAESPWLAMALNNAWANATLFKTLTTFDQDIFIAPRPGFFPSLAATMNHIHEVDLFYLDALEAGGQGRGVYDRVPVTDATELANLQMGADMRLASFCNGIAPRTLVETRTTDRKTGPVKETVANLLLHLIQHQIHHRGQAHAQLSHAGIAPPQLDDFYLEFGRVPSAAAYWG
jgi:uncharacterized damage-inducible protein DinB